MNARERGLLLTKKWHSFLAHILNFRRLIAKGKVIVEVMTPSEQF